MKKEFGGKITIDFFDNKGNKTPLSPFTKNIIRFGV